eukprot:13547630-Alexandrium_andersonii.AAC.1
MAVHSAGRYLAASEVFRSPSNLPTGGHGETAPPLRHLRPTRFSTSGAESGLPHQRASAARNRGLRDPHPKAAHMPDR